MFDGMTGETTQNRFIVRARGPSRSWLIALILALTAMMFPVAAWGQNSVQWKTNYYTVGGSTLREIRQSIDRARPWKGKGDFDGLTVWQIRWQTTLTPTRDECRFTFSTQTSIAITLPRWLAPTNAPATVRGAWQRYIKALEQHEIGHGQFALAAAAEMHQRARNVDADPDCENVRRTLNTLARSVTEEYRQKEREYDQRTGHGLKQGVVLRPLPDQ